MDMATNNQQRSSSTIPPVRVDVRHGSARPITFDLTGEEFLIGSVPGCDLRLPGVNLPPNICLIKRGEDGVRLRKLAPTLPILINGSPMSPSGQALLKHGDVISVGAVDLHVVIDFRVPEPAPLHYPREDYPPEPARPMHNVGLEKLQAEIEQRRQELEARAQALDEQARELDDDRVLWYQRREEIDKELKTARSEIDEKYQQILNAPKVSEAELRSRIERELAEQWRDRRDELERMQLALREAAVQLRERKQQFEDDLRTTDPKLRELKEKEATVEEKQRRMEADLTEFTRKRDGLDADRRIAETRFKQREQDLARREVELAERDMQLRELTARTEADKNRYQADLVRIDRLSAALESKEQALQQRAADIDRRYDQFQQDTRDLEEQLRMFDEREERAKTEEARLAGQRDELDRREATLNIRLAQVETQQATLAALRTKLEHVRDELQAEEARITAERIRLDDETRSTHERLRNAEHLREQIESERDGHAESYRLYQQRSELMAQAVERLKTMQEQLATEDVRLNALNSELETKSAQFAEQTGLLRAQAAQLLEAQERFEADKISLREREAALREAEQARTALQEQLRQRAEELAQRQRESDARAKQLDDHAKQLAEQLRQLEELRTEATTVRRLTDEEAAILAARDEKLHAAEATIRRQQHELADAKALYDAERMADEERLVAAKREIEQLKEALSERTHELLAQMPDLEQRAQGAMDRTAQAREAMRAQLAELHSYALRSQEDLQAVRSQIQDELQRLREQEQTLNRARAEHRLSVSTFRQQLIEWQNRFTEMRQNLHQGETKLDRREKVVEATEQQLVKQAEFLQSQEKEVTEKRTEVDRHIGDMRDWYRKKFREIAETRWSKYRTAKSDDPEAEASAILQLPPRDTTATPPTTPTPLAGSEGTTGGAILPLPDDLDPADRKLGELLQTLDFVDRETLLALWDEARRQRRTLRQVLLAGGYLTLYQLALIESGNVNGLMLGRFRVVDRLLSTPREAIYRVFDPQLVIDGPRTTDASSDQGTCLLRHLGDAEMLDAVRPDEYRQRFSAARDLAHPNVAATLEVLEINQRPAIVQEWLHGLLGAEWPANVSSPGVWHRLLMQAAQGLHAAHEAGLTHGRLGPNSFLLTRSGIVKIIGIGEPPWLYPGQRSVVPVEDDLKALGQVALHWATAATRRKGTKPRAFPNALQDILRGLGTAFTPGQVPLAMYPTVAALLNDLDRVAHEIPADHQAWDKLLHYATENAGDGIILRQSA